MLNVIDSLIIKVMECFLTSDKIGNVIDSMNNASDKIVNKINDFLVDFLG